MIDSGDPTNIHPYTKFLTGTRLANHALRLSYGYNNNSRGPSYLLSYPSGNAMNIIFRTYGSSLFSDQPNNLRAFAIAGEDGNFVFANAEIINNTTVSVSHPSVPNPKYVRYAWSDNPGFVNLFDATGLPARPFRTDELPTPYE
jgi:sialate O-acetylesterase